MFKTIAVQKTDWMCFTNCNCGLWDFCCCSSLRHVSLLVMSVVHLGRNLSAAVGRLAETALQPKTFLSSKIDQIIQDWPKKWRSISREDSGGSWRCQLSSAWWKRFLLVKYFFQVSQIYIKESACSVQFGRYCPNLGCSILFPKNASESVSSGQ